MSAHAALAELDRSWKVCPVCGTQSGHVHTYDCPVAVVQRALSERDATEAGMRKQLASMAQQIQRLEIQVEMRRTGRGEFKRSA